MPGSQRCFCSVGAEQVDRTHGQAGLHADERVDAAVAAGQFQRDHAPGEPGQSGAAVALDRAAHDAERGQLGHQLERELGAFPVVVDDRQHLCVDE
jgi:hypothetical protein